MYSQGKPFFAQRAQLGLSPEHLNLEKAQAWQLVRILTCDADATAGAGVHPRLDMAENVVMLLGRSGWWVEI
jgi:hypothetical protein